MSSASKDQLPTPIYLKVLPQVQETNTWPGGVATDPGRRVMPFVTSHRAEFRDGVLEEGLDLTHVVCCQLDSDPRTEWDQSGVEQEMRRMSKK